MQQLLPRLEPLDIIVQQGVSHHKLDLMNHEKSPRTAMLSMAKGKEVFVQSHGRFGASWVWGLLVAGGPGRAQQRENLSADSSFS